MKTDDRIEWLDLLGGFAMVIVFMQHAMVPLITRIILAFHMPLFFWISGYASGIRKNGSYFKFVKKRFFQLLIPWVLWVTIDYAVTLATKIPQGVDWLPLFKAYFVDLFYASNFWFLPCMFISDCVFHAIRKLLDKKQLEETMQCLCNLGFAVGFWLLSWLESLWVSVKLPLKTDVSLMAIGFLFLGGGSQLVVEKIFSLHKLQKGMLGGVLGITALVCVLLNGKIGANFMMYKNEYGNYIYAILGAVCLIYFSVLCITFVGLPSLKRYFLCIRNNSLQLFPIHLLIIRLLTLVVNMDGMSLWASSFLRLLVIHICMIPLCALNNRYLPVLAGKWRPSSRKTSIEK